MLKQVHYMFHKRCSSVFALSVIREMKIKTDSPRGESPRFPASTAPAEPAARPPAPRPLRARPRHRAKLPPSGPRSHRPGAPSHRTPSQLRHDDPQGSEAAVTAGSAWSSPPPVCTCPRPAVLTAMMRL